MPTGAELFVHSLLKLGIHELFTLVGDHLNDVLPIAAKRGMRILDMRHESGVAHAADAWARIHRRPAVALVTGGPGHTNALTGIATAQLAGSPLIAVSGSRSTKMAERGAFQDIDQVSMARPVVKWSAQPPSAAQIPFYLHKAYDEANSGRKGAVHLTIPVDLFGAQADEAATGWAASSIETMLAADQVKGALDLLRSAERPVVVAGSGVWWAGAGDELKVFIERTGLPLYTITMARGIVPDSHPLCFGYADPALNRAAEHALAEADVVLILGKRLDYRLAMGGARLFAPGAKFIQADIHPQELGLNRELEFALLDDVKSALKAFIEQLGGEQWAERPWVQRTRTFRREWEAELALQAANQAEPLHPAAFYSELRKGLPSDTIFSWDGGDFVHWGRAMVPALKPGCWLRLGPLGAIGSALPNALALKLAHPNRPVVLLTGDGALGFYLAELDTAVRHALPIIVIVGNDGGWGLERELQREKDGGTVGCELRRTRYDVIMQGFGGRGETIERSSEIGPALTRALASEVPYCLNVMIRGVRSPFASSEESVGEGERQGWLSTRNLRSFLQVESARQNATFIFGR